jgi:predicted DNA-binding WGR domain protein
MLTLILHRDASATAAARRPARYYRVEVVYNLFGEYSVLRAWGPRGRAGRQVVSWFSNLRDAVTAADHWHLKARARGYHVTKRSYGQT